VTAPSRARRVAATGALCALVVGMAGALEGPVRALQHGHYFNTASSYISFVTVPAALYGVAGMFAGFSVALVLSLILKRVNIPALTVGLVAAALVVFYWGSVFDEPLFSTAGNVAGHVGMLAAALVVFWCARRVVRAAGRGSRRRAMSVLLAALTLSLGLLLGATCGVWLQRSASGSWGTYPSPASLDARSPLNVLLVTIDTLRADHLCCYGYSAHRSPRGDGLGSSPALDQLASEGVLFENAIAPAVVTDPSHTSIMTSIYPPEHGVMRNGERLASRFATLAEILSGAGYGTAAAVSVEHLDGHMSGLSQGFEVYFDRGRHDRFRYHAGWQGMPGSWRDAHLAHTRPAGETVGDAVRWLAQRDGRPFFLWVHLFEPHMPYESHETPGDTFTSAMARRVRSARVDPPYWAETYYDSEVRAADDAVARLLGAVRDAGAYGRTLIVVTADHGEHMTEERAGRENWFSHAEPYEEVCRVPLIVRVPGAAGGLRVPDPVTTMSVGPTVLDALGLPDPRPAVASGSLLSLIDEGPSTRRPLVSLANPHRGLDTRALRVGRWKLLTRHGGVTELYDLLADPLESADLSPAMPSLRDSLMLCLAEITADWESAPEPEGLDPEKEEMLRALGYLD